MLTHGRLILTSHGFMLDEVKSLLQKSLRRKERQLVLSSCRELLAYNKDQLPWKCLLTYLFEDHCLVDGRLLQQLVGCHERGDKYGWVELLLKCYTCRVAACLPVVAMEDTYSAVISDILKATADLSVSGLLTDQPGVINSDLVLTHLLTSWKEQSHEALILSMKLMTICQDHESRTFTKKGLSYLIGKTKKPNIGHLVLAVLWKSTPATDTEMRSYLSCCYKLTGVKDAPVRLVMFAPVAFMLFRDQVKPVAELNTGHVQWSKVPVLSSMPDWAVDKHTHRGKTGRATSHLLKDTSNMTPEFIQEFHGPRPKRDIIHFFTEGTLLNMPALDVNPYWEQTKAIYLKKTIKQQKTVQMTKTFTEMIKNRCPSLFLKYSDQSKTTHEIKISDFFTVHLENTSARKRKASEDVKCSATQSKSKKVRLQFEHTKISVKVESDFTPNALTIEYPKLPELVLKTEDSATSAQSFDTHERETRESDPNKQIVATSGILSWPLLQLPTSVSKVYTRLDMANKKVWKGPYHSELKLNQVLFKHRAMKDVLQDSCILPVEDQRPYLTFPLVTSQQCSWPVKTTIRPYTDVIAKKDVEKGSFVQREDLGIIQLHKLEAHKLRCLPAAIWVHFLWRYALNIGDSGLYNAITDNKLSFVYGIDLDDERGKVKQESLLDLMFVKLPTKVLQVAVRAALSHHKQELLNILTKPVNYASMDRLASEHHVVFHRSQFIERIVAVRKMIASLA